MRHDDYDPMDAAWERAERERDYDAALVQQYTLSTLAPELIAPPITEDRCPMCNRRASGICRGCESDMREQAREQRRGY